MALVPPFLPSRFPLMARRSYALELMTTFCFATALAVVEGGVLGNIAKRRFEDEVSPLTLNFFVAVIAAAPDLANIFSFIWSSVSHGRAKVPIVNLLQLAVVLLIALMAFTPESLTGLVALTVLAMLARTCWSGIITLRPTIWRSNYPPRMRATVVGNLYTVQVLMVALVGIVMGMIMNVRPETLPMIVIAVAGVGLGAFVATRKQRVRRELSMVRGERDAVAVLKPWQGPAVVIQVLRRDKMWAKFMLWMFVLGLGNMLMGPVLTIVLKDQFNLGYLESILITSSITAMVMPVSIPLWAKYLDRSHVVKFRATQTWVFVVSASTACIGVLTHRVEWMYITAVLQGIAYGGGSLAWNLGHVDFAPPSQTSQYMASHVTLNGIRGLLAPFIAVGLYNLVVASGWDALNMDLPTLAAAVVFALSAVMSAVGAAGFGMLLREMQAGGRIGPRAR